MKLLLFLILTISCSSKKIYKKTENVQPKTTEEIEAHIQKELESERVPKEHRDSYMKMVDKNLRAIDELNKKKNKLLTYLVLNGGNENFSLKDFRLILKEVKKLELKMVDHRLDNLYGLQVLFQDRLERERMENILDHLHSRF